jgi:uncharacterized protein (TIGR02757 family)
VPTSVNSVVKRVEDLKDFLDQKSAQFNKPGFIEHDPISIPHLFKKKQDKEIAGLFAATLAWGQRKTIVRKCKELMELMDNDPHNFILSHSEKELRSLHDFKHRTFNSTDLLYFIESLKHYYNSHDSLEDAFYNNRADETIEAGLIKFHNLFFEIDHPHRTRKHVATPERKSTCKRLVMYLRWMVRKDNNGVDFGIWKKISPAQLVCPCDLHVDRVARKLKLIKRKQTDWQTALELTRHLKRFDPTDPVKYDFALFGLGIDEGWSKR